MSSLSSPLLKALFALCVGVAVLCTLARPVLVTLQELHELQHEVSLGDAGVSDADSGLEEVFHAPHCCVHAMVLPPTLMAAPILVAQAPPRFVPRAARDTPLTRFLRPPISA